MPNTIQGQLKADPEARWALVVARFNEFITSKLVGGAVDTLVRHGASDDNIDVVWVPGSFEIPVTAKRLAESGKYAAVVCLGAVIRGGTPHFEYIASEVSKGVAQVALASGVPVASRRGRYTSMVVPSPSSLCTHMSPPLCLMIPYTVESPSPVPLPASFVVKNGSNIRCRVDSSIPTPVSVTTSTI